MKLTKILSLVLALCMVLALLPAANAEAAGSNIRLYGATRYETAFKTADELKEVLGVSKFQNIIVASGDSFADALAGSYLAAAKNTPILLVRSSTVTAVKNYIKNNLKSGGTVYLLGGTAAVPASMESGLKDFTVKRLGGATRYDTNLQILKEAGTDNTDIIVCTGVNFADSLSASALGLPILLVKDGLTAAQKTFLESTTGEIFILGGTAAVNAAVEKQLKAYGPVHRIGGATRYDTSVLVAQYFYNAPDTAVLAYAKNFPDGLCGGPLAYALSAPLILTDSNKPTAAVNYVTGLGISSGYVLGGPGLISDKVVEKIFAAPEKEPVTLKIMFHGSNVTPEASKKVMAELNKYLEAKIGVNLEPIWCGWGDFDTKAVTSLAAGEDVDIYYTCNWSANEYNQYAKDGYYVMLDELLPTYAPELLDVIPEDIWACAKTDGYDGMGVYAVPALKDTATQICWDVNGTLLAELGYDVDAVCAAGIDYYSNEFTAMLQKAKDAKGADFYPLVIEAAVLERMVNNTAIITGDIGSGNVLSYYFDPANPSKAIGSTIVNKFATKEFEKFAKRTYELSQLGFISPACQSTTTANDYRTSATSAGDYLFCTQSYFFGCEADYAMARGIDVRMVPTSTPYMDCTSGQGAMMAISAISKYPVEALQFLNLLNTDPYVMTTLNYGLEDYTYETNRDGTISFIYENRANYSPWRNGMGNIRILPATEYEGTDYWDAFSAYYDSAQALPYGGFIYDSSYTWNEQAAIANVYAEYAFNLMSGAVNPDKVLPEFLSKLKQAGIDKFVAEANNQLETYMAKSK